MREDEEGILRLLGEPLNSTRLFRSKNILIGCFSVLWFRIVKPSGCAEYKATNQKLHELGMFQVTALFV